MSSEVLTLSRHDCGPEVFVHGYDECDEYHGQPEPVVEVEHPPEIISAVRVMQRGVEHSGVLAPTELSQIRQILENVTHRLKNVVAVEQAGN